MQGGSVESLVQRSTCHIRCDDDTVDDLRLYSRCHDPTHATADCHEFGDLGCPRCLEWNHWEDTCHARDDVCKVCQVTIKLQVWHRTSFDGNTIVIFFPDGWPLRRCAHLDQVQAAQDGRGHARLGVLPGVVPGTGLPVLVAAQRVRRSPRLQNLQAKYRVEETGEDQLSELIERIGDRNGLSPSRGRLPL